MSQKDKSSSFSSFLYQSPYIYDECISDAIVCYTASYYLAFSDLLNKNWEKLGFFPSVVFVWYVPIIGWPSDRPF